MTYLQKAVALSPVPIYFINWDDIKKYVGYILPGAGGRFVDSNIWDHGEIIKEWPNDWKPPFILIDDTMNDFEKVAVVLHEIGHALCDKIKCKCVPSTENHGLSEYHANKYAVEQCLERKWYRSLFYLIENISLMAGMGAGLEPTMAAGYFTTTELYQKSIIPIKERYEKEILSLNKMKEFLAEWKKVAKTDDYVATPKLKEHTEKVLQRTDFYSMMALLKINPAKVFNP